MVDLPTTEIIEPEKSDLRLIFFEFDNAIIRV